MNRKRYKQLAIELVKLPYFVFKKKYLIPPPPIGPKYNGLIRKNGKILEQFRKSLPEIVDVKLISQTADPNQHQQLVDLYKKQIRKKKEQFRHTLEQYKEKYIRPLLIPRRLSPALLFFRENKGDVEEYFKRSQKQWGFGEINRLFKAQEYHIVSQYTELSDKQHEVRLSLHKKAVEMYTIPQYKSIKAYHVYHKEIDGQANKSFQQLSEEVKNVYVKKAAQINRERERRLITFLGDRGLTLQDYQRIRSISDEIEALKKKIKMQKQIKQGQGQEQKEEEPNLGAIEHLKAENNKEQQVLKSKKIIRKPKKPSLQAKERQEEDSEQEKFDFQSEADIINFESSSDDLDIIDFDEKERTIFELKRMSNNNKFNKRNDRY